MAPVTSSFTVELFWDHCCLSTRLVFIFNLTQVPLLIKDPSYFEESPAAVSRCWTHRYDQNIHSGIVQHQHTFTPRIYPSCSSHWLMFIFVYKSRGQTRMLLANSHWSITSECTKKTVSGSDKTGGGVEPSTVSGLTSLKLFMHTVQTELPVW